MKEHKISQMYIWNNSKGTPIACEEKIKVMQENMDEFKQIAQDIFEDGILMDCDEIQLKKYMENIIQKLTNPYKK